MYQVVACLSITDPYICKYVRMHSHQLNDVKNYVTVPLNVTGPAKIDHVSAKKSPIFTVFAVS